MSNLVSRITDSEVEVLKVLWKAGVEVPMSFIRERLEETTEWEYSTIKTLLRRLCKKEVVKSEKKEVYYYEALVSEEEYNDYNTQVLIDRVYSGKAKNLVASLLGSKKLNKDDIEELREMFKLDGDKDE